MQLWCNLADGLSMNPPIFPKQRCLSIAGRHGGGGKEECSLSVGEVWF
jgi:hypothetical protein